MSASIKNGKKRIDGLKGLILAGMCMIWACQAVATGEERAAQAATPEQKALALLDSRGLDPVNQLKKLVKEPGFDLNAVDESSRSLLDLAAIFEHLDSLKLLLDCGANVNANEGGRGDTVLMWSNTKAIAELLLARGADVKLRNGRGETALMVSLWRRRYDVADLFLSRGLNVNDTDSSGQTALMKAARDGRMRALCFLLERKADPSLTDKQGNTALSLAVKHKRGQAVKLLNGTISLRDQQAINDLLESLNADSKDPAHRLRTWIDGGKLDPAMCVDDGDPLLYALVNWDMKESVKLLLDAGADPNTRDDWRNDPLLVAARNVEMATLLLEHGADLNARNGVGENVLSAILYYYDREAVADFLLSKGLNIDDGAENGDTALMRAVQYGNAGAVRYLLSKGADRSVKNKAGLTALDLARQAKGNRHNELIIKLLESDPESLKPRIFNPGVDQAITLFKGRLCTVKALRDLLSEHKMDVNACDRDGMSLLIWAVYCDQPQAVKYLVQQKADVNVQDDAGKTALMYAVDNGDRDMVALLIGNGADPTLRDEAGRKAIDMMDDVDKKTRSQIARLIERAQSKAKQAKP